MSFILDALKKSENERQQQGAAEFSAIPTSVDSPRAPKWLWIVGALLTVNVVVLSVILVRNDTPPNTQVSITSEAVPLANSDATSEAQTSAPAPSRTPIAQPELDESPPVDLTFSEQVAAAKSNQPTIETQRETEPQRPQATVNRSTPAAHVRTFDEVRVQGLFQMADLHLDIHVFGETSADRFVFINMRKHREKSQLLEGPTVTEITPDGVILEYQGTTFLLPRE